jgi:hypothetical protein
MRNILFACIAILAVGAIAGLAMRPHGYLSQGYQPPSQTYEPSSSFSGDTRGQPAAPSSNTPSGDSAQTISLSQVDRPDRTLPHMPVESESGKHIGDVARVMMDSSGKAREVVLDQGTRISAEDLRFAPARSVLIAQAELGRQNAPGDQRQHRDDQRGYGPPDQQPRDQYPRSQGTPDPRDPRNQPQGKPGGY